MGKHDGRGGTHAAGKGGAHTASGTAKDTGYVGAHRERDGQETKSR